MWAREQGGVVAEVTDRDPAGRYHPDIQWVPVPDALRHWVEPGTWSVTEAGAVAPPSLDAMADRAKARLAGIRYEREVGGTALPDGTTVPTKREDQSMAHGAYQALQAGLIDSTDFKTPSGWVQNAGLEQIAPIARAVAAHVDRCFRAERQVAEQIDAAEDAEALAAIDLAAAFDAAYAALADASV